MTLKNLLFPVKTRAKSIYNEIKVYKKSVKNISENKSEIKHTKK